MSQKPLYRYFAKPLSDNTNEILADRLAALNEGCKVENQIIKVNGKEVLGVYQVTHTMLTELSHSVAHRGNIRTYVQEGEGKIRPYTFLTSKTRISAQARAIKLADKLLAGINNKRPYAARPKDAKAY